MYTEDYLENIGIKKADNSPSMPPKRFEDGAQYRFEVPGIQKPETLSGLIDALDHFEVQIHRVTQTKGIMLLTDSEILEMADMAREAGLELFLSVGPRATYDTSASAQTKEGARIGYRLRGYQNLVYAIEDVKRAVNLGVRGIVLYDEGLLWVLSKMRSDGELPFNVHFKISAHTGHGNPASARLMQDIGADSFNPVRDLSVTMMHEIRQVIDISLDIHTENPKSSGGFIRHYEAPEIIRRASPVYLKTGGAVAAHHGWDTTSSQAAERVRQVRLVQDMINRYYPEATKSKLGSEDLAIPEKI
ncbi:peptidase [Methanobacterium sp. CWC-01]|uniref:peptidase n=1 Tax=Methanobacterium aridiramus TaxID=2584467 RepID=UPI0025749540|nr:peptidase [Methanobacterium sp. CWC-01]WJI09841.1 peptidase [Methanobacterium sp. CWC-01]